MDRGIVEGLTGDSVQGEAGPGSEGVRVEVKGDRDVGVAFLEPICVRVECRSYTEGVKGWRAEFFAHVLEAPDHLGHAHCGGGGEAREVSGDPSLHLESENVLDGAIVEGPAEAAPVAFVGLEELPRSAFSIIPPLALGAERA